MYEEYARQGAIRGHRRYKSPAPPQISPSAGDGTVIDWNGRNQATIGMEPTSEKCCPDSSPISLAEAWGLWLPIKHELPPPVAENIPEIPLGVEYSKFCLRFVWVCSCEDEQFCSHEILNDSERSLFGWEDYRRILSAIAPTGGCKSSLYAFEFFGTARLNPAYDPITNPSAHKRIYQRGTAYRAYLLAQAPIG